MTEVTLRLDTDRRLIRAEGLSVRYLHLALQAPPATEARAPVDLALVLDRSGSMNGAKWHQARQAAPGESIVQVTNQLRGSHASSLTAQPRRVRTIGVPMPYGCPVRAQMPG